MKLFHLKERAENRTTKMNSVFVLIASIKGNKEQNKTGTSEVISGSVASTGIAPPAHTERYLPDCSFRRVYLELRPNRRSGLYYPRPNGISSA